MNDIVIGLLTTLSLILIFLIAALPLKNWLELKRCKAKETIWEAWLKEKPSREEYCKMHQQNFDSPICDYCGSNRQMPSLEMVISHKPKFGMITNSFDKYSHYRTFICSGCGTQLFRQRFEE